MEIISCVSYLRGTNHMSGLSCQETLLRPTWQVIATPKQAMAVFHKDQLELTKVFHLMPESTESTVIAKWTLSSS